MTAIAGLASEGNVWIGADAAGVESSTLFIVQRKDPKVFRAGPFLIGCTSSFRMAQLLRFGEGGEHLDDPRLLEGAEALDPYDQIVSRVMPRMRSILKSGGYLRVVNSEETGGSFLLGFAGRLFFIDPDLQVGESALPFYAAGCGRDLALGSLYSSCEFLEMPPAMRIERALKAAEAFSAGVRGPFTVLSLENERS